MPPGDRLLRDERSDEDHQTALGYRPRSRNGQDLQLPMLTLSAQEDHGGRTALSHPSMRRFRPTLPPLSQLHTPTSNHSSSAFSHGAFPSHDLAQGHSYLAHQAHQSSHAVSGPLPALSQGSNSLPIRSGGLQYHSIPPIVESPYSHDPRGIPFNPRKRSHEVAEMSVEKPFERSSLVSTASIRDMSEHSAFPTSGSVSTTSTPTTASYPGFSHATASSSRLSNASSNPNVPRCSLIIRQQPRAARAGPDGKDRRPIDPPPVVQLMMNDFNPSSAEDLQELQSQFWVVQCRLLSANSPRRDVSSLVSMSEDGSQERQNLLLGSSVASPTVTEDDPDPETMPIHPVTIEQPPSPSSRFIAPSRAEKQPAPGSLPGTFFIFADLSVRKAGKYRLEFLLMKMESPYLVVGGKVPMVHSISSAVFRVVNAKDFDQVQPSTRLVHGLIERGAGFPLKLKKGTREGQRRRGTLTEGGEEGSTSEDE